MARILGAATKVQRFQLFQSDEAFDPLMGVDGAHCGILPCGISLSNHPEIFRMAVVAEDADAVAVMTNGANENDDCGDDAIACEAGVHSEASERACTCWD